MNALGASELPHTMTAVLLTGFGGLDKLDYRTDVPVPAPADDEVLVQVGAAGVNNTDVNTRTGWYSKAVRDGTGSDESEVDVSDDGGWAGESLVFPKIQGADVAGTVVAVGSAVSADRIGERVLVRSMQQAPSGEHGVCVTMGSEINGGFAQFCAVRSEEAFAITTDLTDAELASFPCAWSTAEGLLERAGLVAGERVLITGASGGVGSAAIQLAKRRGAHVIAAASASKWATVTEWGADQVIDRDADFVEELGANSVDVVADVVGGDSWPQLLEVLKLQGRYATSGAIAGPIVELDLRTLYLKDLTLVGSTFQPRSVFENLVSYIERGEVTPVVARTYALRDIAQAQQDFVAKTFAGKLVLLPPAVEVA